MLLRDLMPVNVFLWRVGIGILDVRFFVKLNKSKFEVSFNVIRANHFFISWILITLTFLYANPTKWSNKTYSNNSRLLPTNCLSVFDHFLGLALKGLIIFGNTEFNPGPKKDKSFDKLSVCHCNLNSITAHDFSKISVLEACNAHCATLLCLSETYFDFSVPYDDPRLKLSGYKLVRDETTWVTIKGVLSVFISKKPLLSDQYLRTA